MLSETSHTQEPVCPHCLKTIEEWWNYWELEELDSNGIVDCPLCEEEFAIQLHIEFSTDEVL